MRTGVWIALMIAVLFGFNPAEAAQPRCRTAEQGEPAQVLRLSQFLMVGYFSCQDKIPGYANLYNSFRQVFSHELQRHEELQVQSLRGCAGTGATMRFDQSQTRVAQQYARRAQRESTFCQNAFGVLQNLMDHPSRSRLSRVAGKL